MKSSIIGVMRTHIDQNVIEICNDNAPLLVDDLCRFAGAEAGICYMSKPYFNSYVSDPNKAIARFGTVALTGHHSIAGHSQVAILFEGIPKILAMFLNNLCDYETSEKSGRYTVMTGNTEEETQIYEKWVNLLTDIILKEYSDKVDTKAADKLAKENARYFLSIFTPTTMGYTTSLRQFNYIIDWADKYSKCDNIPDNYFTRELKKSFTELVNSLTPLLYVPELRDIKNRNGFDMIKYDSSNKTTEQLGKMYNISYMGSFAEYAQLQRHRTLFYNILFNGVSTDFYIPPIIKGTSYEKEWIADMNSVKDIVPTGTLVNIEEAGKVENFYLKSMERNCGRAQLEIMQQNLKTSEYFKDNIDKFPVDVQNMILKYYKEDKEHKLCPKMKGEIIVCKEPCVWGCQKAKSRKI